LDESWLYEGGNPLQWRLSWRPHNIEIAWQDDEKVEGFGA